MAILLRKILPLLLLLIFTGSLSYLRHKPVGFFNHQTALWADQTGYYAYLPFYFIYDQQTGDWLDKFSQSTGRGFRNKDGKFFTKYAVGVAILQAPVFGILHTYNLMTGTEADGFTGNYHWIPVIGAVLYGSLGIWLFYLFACKCTSRVRAAFVSFLMLCGTNVLFFIFAYSGMSHAYSLFLFAALLWWVDRALRRGDKGWLAFFIAGLMIGLIFITRPLNLLFVLGLLGYFQLQDPRFFRHYILTPKLLVLLVASLIPVLPQFHYWHYLTGEWVYYSYGNEGFTNWNSPKFLQLWFAPQNGLFPWSPAYLLAVAILVYKSMKLEACSILLLITFLILSYSLAAWHAVHFGMGYGSRNYVEYSVLFFIPMLNQKFRSLKLRRAAVLVSVVLAFFSVKMMYTYQSYFDGEIWDWEEYAAMAGRGFYHDQKNFGIITKPTGNKLMQVKHLNAWNKTLTPFKRLNISAEVELYTSKGRPGMVAHFETSDSLYSWNMVSFEDRFRDLRETEDFYASFFVPETLPEDAKLMLYLWNQQGDSLRVSDVHMWLK